MIVCILLMPSEMWATAMGGAEAEGSSTFHLTAPLSPNSVSRAAATREKEYGELTVALAF